MRQRGRFIILLSILLIIATIASTRYTKRQTNQIGVLLWGSHIQEGTSEETLFHTFIADITYQIKTTPWYNLLYVRTPGHTNILPDLPDVDRAFIRRAARTNDATLIFTICATNNRIQATMTIIGVDWEEQQPLLITNRYFFADRSTAAQAAEFFTEQLHRFLPLHGFITERRDLAITFSMGQDYIVQQHDVYAVKNAADETIALVMVTNVSAHTAHGVITRMRERPKSGQAIMQANENDIAHLATVSTRRLSPYVSDRAVQIGTPIRIRNAVGPQYRFWWSPDGKKFIISDDTGLYLGHAGKQFLQTIQECHFDNITGVRWDSDSCYFAYSGFFTDRNKDGRVDYHDSELLISDKEQVSLPQRIIQSSDGKNAHLEHMLETVSPHIPETLCWERLDNKCALLVNGSVYALPDHNTVFDRSIILPRINGLSAAMPGSYTAVDMQYSYNDSILLGMYYSDDAASVVIHWQDLSTPSLPPLRFRTFRQSIPQFSPDGRDLSGFFMLEDINRDGKINIKDTAFYLINVHDQSSEKLFQVSDIVPHQFIWSSDGRYIVFLHQDKQKLSVYDMLYRQIVFLPEPAAIEYCELLPGSTMVLLVGRFTDTTGDGAIDWRDNRSLVLFDFYRYYYNRVGGMTPLHINEYLTFLVSHIDEYYGVSPDGRYCAYQHANKLLLLPLQ